MGRRAFVTGATGFIGRHLVQQLISDGWNVRALVRSSSDAGALEAAGVDLFRGDLRDAETIAAGLDGADVAYHLAAVTAARTHAEYEATNADGTANLVQGIRLARLPPQRLVYLSSYAAAGPSIDGRPRSLDENPAPLTSYGRTKLRGEQIVREAEGNGLEVVVIRAPAVFGPGDRALLPYFRLVRAGLAPLPGGPGRPLHLVFVGDLAGALKRATDAPSGVYAVADPVEHLWKDVVGTMATVLGKRPVWMPLAPSLVRLGAALTEWSGRIMSREVAFNREKAEEMLAAGWTCDLAGSEMLLPPASVTPLQAGIEQTVRWYIRKGWL